MILDHDSGHVLGRVSAGTLQLREDSIGLYFTLKADPSTPEGQTAIGTVARGDIAGCSFGFHVRAESWRRDIEIASVDNGSFSCTDNNANARRRVVEKAEAAQKLRGIR